MKTSEFVRESFLEFFKERGHKILPSASLVPEDPELLFTIAGMVPFKPYFEGKKEPPHPRIATCQKCVRTNDIESVGKTTYHHTFFEMLGNFSFGDYFKKEAIEWAWEYVTQVLGLEEDKLFVSVYEKDTQSYDIWKHVIGLPDEKIMKKGKEDNFWGPAGPTGPCGPDTEIFYKTKSGLIEIWNLVFTEFHQDENGDLHPLPRKNIDTGAGLERIVAVLQGTDDNFKTDLFEPVIDAARSELGLEYEKNPKILRIVADHARAATFLIADGVYPSNKERGYVIRRIIRRAVTHGYLTGKTQPFLYIVAQAVAEKMKSVYPEVQNAEIFQIIKAEEEKFLRALGRGLKLFEKAAQGGEISGEDAFKLYDTYGFPIELTKELATQRGIEVDIEGYRKHLEEQRKRSKEARRDSR